MKTYSLKKFKGTSKNRERSKLHASKKQSQACICVSGVSFPKGRGWWNASGYFPCIRV